MAHSVFSQHTCPELGEGSQRFSLQKRCNELIELSHFCQPTPETNRIFPSNSSLICSCQTLKYNYIQPQKFIA